MTGTAATAFLFPGQGSQRVGMARDIVAEHPELLNRYYRTADDVLGLPLSTLCFEGPVDELRRTEITQPAVFLTSVATLDVLRAHGVEPTVVAGHSLGEYTALVAAGVLHWTDGLRLVRRRGELMAAANARSAGSMAAVLGLPLATVSALCKRVTDTVGEPVEIANDNDPGQIVVSGRNRAVAAAADAARAAGAVRVVMLDVGAAFHSSLMSAVEDDFAVALRSVDLREPALPVVANVTAGYVRTAAEAVACLHRQLAGTVRWTDTLRLLAADGVERFVEVGPGRVLSGFCRATCPGIPSYSTSDARRLRQSVQALTTPGLPTHS